MAKEYSIGYKFKGDPSGFQKAVGEINKNLGSMRKGMTGMISTLRNFAAVAGIAFSIRGLSKYAQESVKLAAVAGNLGKVGKDSVKDLDDIKTAWRDIRINIGEAILGSEKFNMVTGKIKERTEMIAKRGLGALFISKKEFDRIETEKAKWDVDRFGNPLKSEKPHKTEEQLKAAKETVKTVADYVKQIKEAAAEADKLAKAWEIIHKETAAAKGGPIQAVVTSQLGMPGFGAKLPGLQKPPAVITDTTDALEEQMRMVENLTSAFGGMFMNVQFGFKAMINSMIADFQRYVAELLAKQVVLFVIKMLMGGGGIKAIPTGNISMPTFSAPLPGLRGAPVGMNMQGMRLSVGGRIAGRDIYLSAMRYDNMLGELT